MIAAVGVEDRSSLLQGFTVYLEGLTGDKMYVSYGAPTAEAANDQAREIHDCATAWMKSSGSLTGSGHVRLKLLEARRGTA